MGFITERIDGYGDWKWKCYSTDAIEGYVKEPFLEYGRTRNEAIKRCNELKNIYKTFVKMRETGKPYVVKWGEPTPPDHPDMIKLMKFLDENYPDRNELNKGLKRKPESPKFCEYNN